MDKDKSLDIITNDHKGFVKIFYGGKNGQGTYISKDKATCDTGRYIRQVANTQTVTRFGIKLNEDKVVDNSMAHRYGLEMPSDVEVDTSNLSDLGINLTPDQLKQLDNLPEDFDTSQLFDLIGMENFDPNQMASAGADEALKYQEISTDPLADGKKNNVFIPISYLDASKDDNVEIYKTYKDLNGGILENNDLVNVTVTLKAGKKGFSGAFGDKIQGPRKVALNNNGIPKSLAD
ncbi:MAG: hypothetical protein LBO09_07720 [Candidatus Peribacteria bacterium]|jgi:hypothetical protein|nr:hypothetical protein [Candidatus Peribacteria bacterium]